MKEIAKDPVARGWGQPVQRVASGVRQGCAEAKNLLIALGRVELDDGGVVRLSPLPADGGSME